MSVQNEQSQMPTQDRGLDRRRILLGGTALVAASSLSAGTSVRMAQAQQSVPAQAVGRLPNVLAIMADDIGWFNVSAYHRGIMGTSTPNIDRIA
jgi:arylsulfatase